MSKRTSAKYKLDRRMGENVFGRPKSPVNRREYGPGQHGPTVTGEGHARRPARAFRVREPVPARRHVPESDGLINAAAGQRLLVG